MPIYPLLSPSLCLDGSMQEDNTKFQKAVPKGHIPEVLVFHDPNVNAWQSSPSDSPHGILQVFFELQDPIPAF